MEGSEDEDVVAVDSGEGCRGARHCCDVGVLDVGTDDDGDGVGFLFFSGIADSRDSGEMSFPYDVDGVGSLSRHCGDVADDELVLDDDGDDVDLFRHVEGFDDDCFLFFIFVFFFLPVFFFFVFFCP